MAYGCSLPPGRSGVGKSGARRARRRVIGNPVMSTPGPSAWKYPMSIARPIQVYVGCHAPNRTPNSVEEVRSIDAVADVVPEDLLSETLTSALQSPVVP